MLAFTQWEIFNILNIALKLRANDRKRYSWFGLKLVPIINIVILDFFTFKKD